MSIFAPIPHVRILSVMPTYRCTAACTHCGTESSPDERTSLHLEDILTAIDQAADLGYDMVVFTGGEATLARRNLIVGIERASAHGLPVRLVTNAYWAITDKAARRFIGQLIDAGLGEINFSTGDQHIRFVPVERVIRATEAAAERGLKVAIMIENLRTRHVTRATLEDDQKFQEIRRLYPQPTIDIMESPWMPLSPYITAKYPDGVAINKKNLALRKGCDSVLTTTTVQADGRIAACCGLGMRQIPELQTGDIRKDKLADAEQAAADDFLKHWIRVEGPEHILAWASTHNAAIEWENMYAHRCQACLRLYKDPQVRQVIREHYHEKVSDVLFAEWLLFHDVPADSPAVTDETTYSYEAVEELSRNERAPSTSTGHA
jgi:organic radical activating enzyme